MATRNKIRAAFRELRGLGYFARQDHGDCQSCGLESIPQKTPYVFYHHQDAETVCHSGKLYLAFGILDGDKNNNKQIVRIGKAIRDVFEKHGVTVDWDETAATRIQLVWLDQSEWPNDTDRSIDLATRILTEQP